MKVGEKLKEKGDMWNGMGGEDEEVEMRRVVGGMVGRWGGGRGGLRMLGN